jgi:hypothetical protein
MHQMEPLKTPPPYFEDVVARHFANAHVQARLLREVGQWVLEDAGGGGGGQRLSKARLAQLRKLLPAP